MTTIRELKKDAKVRLSGNYFKILFIYLLYGIIVFAFSYLSKYIQQSVIRLIYSFAILIFSIPLSYGVISCILDIVRGKNTSLTEFINVGLKNIGRTWGIYLRILLRLLFPIIFFIASTFFTLLTIAGSILKTDLGNYFILSIILLTVSIVLLIILNLYYAFAFYLLKDKPEKSSKELVLLSKTLMKGNLIKYITLGLSFFGWYLLIFAVSFVLAYFLPSKLVNLVPEIGSLFIFPYITTTLIGFYEDVLYDKTNAEEKE